MSDKNSKFSHSLLLLLPSMLALAISITALMYQFGSRLFDLNNTCYYVYFGANDSNGNQILDEEINKKIEEIVVQCEIKGFTLSGAAKGGYIDENQKLVFEDSYRLILLDISKKKAYEVAQKLQDALNQKSILVEEVVILKKFVADGKIYESYENLLEDKK